MSLRQTAILITLAVITFAIFAVVIVLVLLLSPRPAAPPPIPPTPTGIISLEFLSLTGTSSTASFIVEGQVKNTGTITCSFVSVVVNYYDAAGDFITSDETFLRVPTLAPGETSSFRVSTLSTGYPDYETFDAAVKGCL